jgi:hypothetical protein
VSVFQSPPVSQAAILSQLPGGVAVWAGAAGTACAGSAGAGGAWRAAYATPSATRAARARAATATRNSRWRGVRVASRDGSGFSWFGGRTLRDLCSATSTGTRITAHADHEKITLPLSENALVMRLNYPSTTERSENQTRSIPLG